MTSHRRGAFWPAGVALLTFLVLARVTWRRSGQFLIDFGRELYLPWQISQGAVLYRDVESLMGPAAPYLNGLAFWAAGPSVRTLLLVNLIILLLIAALLFLYFMDVIDRSVLALLLVAFLVLATLSQVSGRGVYSFLTPYSHDATHGFLYALGALLATLRHEQTGRPPYAAAAGLLLGTTFLTKPELFLAALAACLSTLAVSRARDRKDRQPAEPGSFGVLVACTLAVPVAAFVAFGTAMSTTDALSAAAGAWRHIGGVGATDSPYYLMVSGLDSPLQNTGIMAAFAAAVLIGWIGIRTAARVFSEALERSRPARLVVAAVCVGSIVLALTYSFSWLRFPRAVPLLSVLALIQVVRMGFAETDRSIFRRKWLPLIAWGVFALVLLAKTILAVRLHQHGFYLATPAVLFLIAVALDVIPARTEQRHGTGVAFAVRSWFLALIVTPIALQAVVSYLSVAERSLAIGQRANEIRHLGPPLSQHGLALERVLVEGERIMPPSATLAVLPEGAGVNFLLARPNPTPYVSIIPPELEAFGEETIVARLEESRPSFILTWPRRLYDYGYGRFGLDTTYAPAVLALLRRSYDPVFEVDLEHGINGSSEASFRLFRLRD